MTSPARRSADSDVDLARVAEAAIMAARPGKPPRGARFAPHEKPKDARGTIARLFGLTRGHRGGLLAAMALSCLLALPAVVGPRLIGNATNAIEAGDPVRVTLLLLVAIYLGDSLVRILQTLVLNVAGQRIVRDVRVTLFAALGKLPLAFFDRNARGELMSRITNDVDNIASTLSTSLAELMVLLFTIVGMVGSMLALDVGLTAVCLVAVALVFVFTRFLTKRTRPLYVRQQQALGALNAQVEEGVGGLDLVAAFGRQDRMCAQFEALSSEYANLAARAEIWSGYLMPITGIIGNLIYVAVAVLGGLMVTRGAADVGLVTSFLVYSKIFVRPFRNIADMYNTLQSALAGAERVFAVMDEACEPPDAPDALELREPRGHLALRHVTFGYDPARPVLRDVSLDIPAGTRVAVVGATGSGKTTLINLLTRFYDVDEGSIELDGHDLRRYRLADVRAAFGAVLQDAVLVSATVLENVAYGRPDPHAPETRAEVERALEAAGADAFVSRLPQGLDTYLANGGAELSQGERQLLTIARAMVANAPILILDEATSSVDTVTEQRIRRSILELARGRTSVVIAHRLSTVRDSDLIVVLDDGAIAEQGTHDELLALGGRYARMWRVQTGAPADGLDHD